MAIPTPIIRHLDESNILRTMAIDLSENVEDRAAIIEVLRSKLYSNKVLAPIREYSTNAMDSHVEAGCPDRPIKVVLPTSIFPELRIRDFGIGLTPEEIERIYIKYGRSTKRNTNSQTGQLGLGCKSAFAYGDNFIVISYKDGVKTTYNLTISGVCTIIAAEPMLDDDEVGMEIVVPVNQTDVRDFQTEAINFFKYWKICPEISGGDCGKLETLRDELAQKPLFFDEDWEIRPKQGYSYGTVEGVAVMGNVPYPINWDIVSSKLNLRSDDSTSVLYDFIRSNKTILRFGIGELDFSASRESLEYTEKTCKAVIEKVKDILDNIFKILESKISGASNYWEALLIYNQIFGRDDEKLFQGDVHRLEKYYKGKFAWNGINIESGAFEHIENFDIELGYSPDGKWKSPSNGLEITGSNPVLTIYENYRNRIKTRTPNEYSNNRIPASKKTCIVIHDLDKPVLMKASVRWIMNEMDPANHPGKVYLLRFKDSAKKKEFFDKMHFESVPVLYVSDIIGKVKNWLKSSRASGGTGSPGIRNPQTHRCVVIGNQMNKNGYFSDVSFIQEEIDIKEEEGYYVDLEDGNAMVNGEQVYRLSSLSHHAWVLLKALGEVGETVYALPERHRKTKWFGEATKSGQWTKLEEYLQQNEDAILYGKGIKAAKSIKFFKACEDNYIGIKFAEKILPLLTNKNGAMYKACVEISSELREIGELTNALHFFKMGKDLADSCTVDFDGLFKAVHVAYPLLTHLRQYCEITNNSKLADLNITFVAEVADYVNMIDGK